MTHFILYYTKFIVYFKSISKKWALPPAEPIF